MKRPFKVLCQNILIYSCERESHLSIHLPIPILSHFNLPTWWARNGISCSFYFAFPWLLMELSLFLLFVGCLGCSSVNALFTAFGHFLLGCLFHIVLWKCAFFFHFLLSPLGWVQQYWCLLKIPVQCNELELHSFPKMSFPKLKRCKPHTRVKRNSLG